MRRLSDNILITVFIILTISIGAFTFNRLQNVPAKTLSVKPLWTREETDLKNIAFSQNGKYFALVDSQNDIKCHKSNGDLVYATRSKAPIDTAVLSPDADYTLVYSSEPARRVNIAILNSDGKVHYSLRIENGVSSADCYSTKNGAIFAVGTHSNYIYIVEVGPRRKRYNRFKVPGTLTSVCFSGANSIIYGTKAPGSAACVTLKGQKLWTLANVEEASRNYVSRLKIKDTFLLNSVPNDPDAKTVFVVMDKNGKKISGSRVEDTENGVLISSCG